MRVGWVMTCWRLSVGHSLAGARGMRAVRSARLWEGYRAWRWLLVPWHRKRSARAIGAAETDRRHWSREAVYVVLRQSNGGRRDSVVPNVGTRARVRERWRGVGGIVRRAYSSMCAQGIVQARLAMGIGHRECDIGRG